MSGGIGSGATVKGYIEKNLIKSVLFSGIAATTLATVVLSAEAAGGGYFANLIQTGGPVMIGNLVGGLIITPPTEQAFTQIAELGVISGAVAVAISMYAGSMPVLLDMQTANFILMAAGATTIGYFAAQLF